MVRPRTIDRERLLDIAESIISEAGAVTISFGGLAEAAGLSKASVQSVFGTREAMMEALLERWLRKEQRAYQKKIGPQSSLRERVRRHVKITGKESSEANSRLAAVLTALVGSDATEGVMAKWYASRVGKFSAETQEERLLRIAFLAAEGAFSCGMWLDFRCPIGSGASCSTICWTSWPNPWAARRARPRKARPWACPREPMARIRAAGAGAVSAQAIDGRGGFHRQRRESRGEGFGRPLAQRARDMYRADRTAVGAQHRHAYAYLSHQHLLDGDGVAGHARLFDFLADLPERGDGLVRERGAVGAGDDVVDLGAGQVGQDGSPAGGAERGHAVPHQGGEEGLPLALQARGVDQSQVVEHAEVDTLQRIAPQVEQDGEAREIRVLSRR